MSHFGGLGVKTADFNKDGFEDIVVGGNGAVPVRIFYMMRNSVGNPAVEFVEILEEGTSPISGAGSWPNTFGCYGVTVGDFNQDSWPDIVVTRRLGMRFLGPPPSLPPNQGQHDSVWINDAVPGNPPTSGTAPTCFDNSIVIPL
ncbi:MAG: VCBS repeat-containing protein, partial [Planctomycetes bacterium]|nr:VCBS repeat-containing protein [Planctomycetota bacterium]